MSRFPNLRLDDWRLDPPHTDDGGRFDTFRDEVLRGIRDDGYAASAAITIVRRHDESIHAAFEMERGVDTVVAEILAYEDANDTPTIDYADDAGGGPVG